MATKLSPAMRAAMGRLTRKWEDAYTLRVGLNTLWALAARKLVEGKGGLGSSWCPRTGFKWRLTEKGERMRRTEAVIDLVRRA